MRTTLTIDDDVIEVAKDMAQARKIRTGKALSELARRGWQASVGTRRVGVFTVFDVPADSAALDLPTIRATTDADDAARHGGQAR